nr:MAG TPA: hypothetical protein [Caudoviricetes sp.]
MTSDLNTIFGHRLIYTRGEAATIPPNLKPKKYFPIPLLSPFSFGRINNA